MDSITFKIGKDETMKLRDSFKEQLPTDIVEAACELDKTIRKHKEAGTDVYISARWSISRRVVD